ncbi:MAG: sugar ABC transporter permease YjfF [Clostridiales bacterium]|nr:sugar ABC transporter permease YjfF [Clostridiales bacterium]
MTAQKAKTLTGKKEPLSNTMLLMLVSIGIFIAMYAAAVIFNAKGFRNPKMFFDLLNENSMLIFIACSLTVVMIGGGINISVAGVVSLTCMVDALYLQKSAVASPFLNILISLGIALGIGLAFGAFQGFLISHLEIQPFIVTLAGMILARGLTTIVSPGGKPVDVNATGAVTAMWDARINIPWFTEVTEKVKLGRVTQTVVSTDLEIGTLVALLVLVLVFLLLRYAKLGRNIYAIGGNQQSAMMLGINVKRTRFVSYVISGLLSGLAGFIFLMHAPSAKTTVAARGEMDAIAASIIGGTLLTGGVGNVFGTFFGVMILATITKIIGLSDVNESFWQNIASGAMLGLFIMVQSVILSVRGKGKIHLPEWLKFIKPKGEPISPAK